MSFIKKINIEEDRIISSETIFKYNNFEYQIADPFDPQLLLLGEINNSCMKIFSAGESCLNEFFINKSNAIMTISYEGRKIAYSWLRISSENWLLFDNVECDRNFFDNSDFLEGFRQSCLILLKKYNFNKIVVGGGYTKIDFSKFNIFLIDEERYLDQFGNKDISDLYTDLVVTPSNVNVALYENRNYLICEK